MSIPLMKDYTPVIYSFQIPATTKLPFPVKSAFQTIDLVFHIYPIDDYERTALPPKEDRLKIFVHYKDYNMATRTVPLSIERTKNLGTIEPTLFHGESVFVPVDFTISTTAIIDAFTRLKRDTLVYIMRNEDFEYHYGAEVCRRLKKYFKIS